MFNLLAAISVLLLLATAATWVRSFSHMDEIVRNPPNGNGTCYILAWNRGVLALNLCDAETNYDEGWSIQWAWERFGVDPLVYSNYQSPIFERLGFSYQFVTDGSMPDRRWTIPHWSAALLLAIIPGIWLFHAARRSRQVKTRICQTCGYDLRATPDRCPECGTAPKGNLISS